MSLKKMIFALATACLLSGCATGPVFTEAPPPEGKALVYIYRAPTIGASGQTTGFDVDEKRITTLDPGGYTYFYAAPGHYEIKQFWPIGLMTITTPALWQSIRLPMDLKAGETHYFRFGTAIDAMPITVRWRFDEVPSDVARQEIGKEKLQPLDKNIPSEFKP
jgi:hypothetical protein